MDIQDIWVVVPVGKRDKYLSNLLKKLHKYNGRIVFVNNNKVYNKYLGVVHIEDFEEINIHRWWNKGIDYAEKHGAKYVAVLNDDLDFNDDFIEKICKFNYENKYSISQVSGAAWLLDLESKLRADENLRWWYGDTKIFKQANELNGLGHYIPDYFKHFEPDNQTVGSQELMDLAAADGRYYNSLK